MRAPMRAPMRDQRVTNRLKKSVMAGPRSTTIVISTIEKKAPTKEAVKAAVQEVVPEVIKAVTPAQERVGVVASPEDTALDFLKKSIDDMTTNEKNELAALTIRWLRGDFE